MNGTRTGWVCLRSTRRTSGRRRHRCLSGWSARLPTKAVRAAAQRICGEGKVLFLAGLADHQLCAVYSSARLLLFPSLAEGFGWPIAEAMTCGCPVLTTGQAPMTEVGGKAAYYLPLRPDTASSGWARAAADKIVAILTLPAEGLLEQRRRGLAESGRFDTDRCLDEYERIYLGVLKGGAICVASQWSLTPSSRSPIRRKQPCPPPA